MFTFTTRGLSRTCAILVAGVMASQAFAQVRSKLSGTVLDPAKSPVAGARITAIPQGTSNGVSVVSESNGEFSLELAPNTYSVRIVAGGFSESTETVTMTDAAQTREFVLPVAPVRSAITVNEGTGYLTGATSSATKTLTPLLDVPQSVTVVTQTQIKDQMMTSIGDVVRYIPGIAAHQGENNRDQVIIRGNSSSADFFVNGVRDDVQYYRDLYNLERVEALKGPNAMIFGRGGGGGVINRVTKEAGFTPLREFSLQGGSFGAKRFTADIDQPLGQKVAFRANGLFENSDSFRKYVNLERYAFNPTLTVKASDATRLTLSYEYLDDHRTADRGITSFQGRPADVAIDTFYGNPNDSRVKANVHFGSANFEHHAGKLTLTNRSTFAAYDRFYQNYVPGAVTADKQLVPITTYNNATARKNVFNQTNLTYTLETGRLRHTLLGGIEAGRQLTDNFRNTGYFNNTATSLSVPYLNPVTFTPVTFRQSATDADNHLKTNLGATYVQDQIEVSRYIQVVAGLRFDHFDLQYLNNRTAERLRRIDNLVSPRAGVVIKPKANVSLYGSYSISYLPSSGDQFSSLTTITQQVKPEKFTNYEVGAKWDANRYLSFTTAVYRLNRTNTRSTDPNDPTRIIQTGSQRTNGFEAGATGSITRAWKVAGGYSYQDAFISAATTAAVAGRQVGQVPHHMFSLWNNYQIIPRLGAGIGIMNRSNMFVGVDNTVVVPTFTRFDFAVFYSVTERVRLQANVENLLDRTYYTNADSNTNISPGFPRAVRVGLIYRF